MNDITDLDSLPECLTGEEAARFLRMTLAALTRMATGSKPRIGSIPQGRSRVFPREAIRTYVEANTIVPAPPNPWGLTDRSHARLRKTG